MIKNNEYDVKFLLTESIQKLFNNFYGENEFIDNLSIKLLKILEQELGTVWLAENMLYDNERFCTYASKAGAEFIRKNNIKLKDIYIKENIEKINKLLNNDTISTDRIN